MSKIILLGLDPSMSGCGYSVLDEENKLLQVGTFNTTSLIDEPIYQYIAIQNGISELINKFGINYISSESVVFVKGQAGTFTPALYSLYIMLQVIFKENRLPVVYFLPKQWRQLYYRPSEFLWAKDGGKTKSQKCKYLKLSEKEKTRLTNLNLDWEVGGKQLSVNRVKEETGFFMNHNEAESYCIAKSGIRFWMVKSNFISRNELTFEEEECFFSIVEKNSVKGLPCPVPIQIKEGIIYKEGKSPGWFDFSSSFLIPSEVHTINKKVTCR